MNNDQQVEDPINSVILNFEIILFTFYCLIIVITIKPQNIHVCVGYLKENTPCKA